MIIRKLLIVKYKVLHPISGRAENFGCCLLGPGGVTSKFGIIRHNVFPVRAVQRFCAIATPMSSLVHQ
jgi:hypothetical protein